jgi:2-dehydro-3-deoxygalactonokinase
MTAPSWIAVDWGTTSLRAYAMGPGGVLAEASSDRGMGVLAKDAFEPALLDLIGPWLAGPAEVLACGMVGSRQGWHEAPYRTVPCTPAEAASLVPVAVRDARLRLRIVPGLKQDRPADVMRGEETQIAGLLARHPGRDGIACLPGTHAKWADLRADAVVSFQTYMTGELFALLSQQSVLRHGLAGAAGLDGEAFDAAVSDALSRPERIGSRLFGLRAEGLIAGLSPTAARSRLSGFLIGLELAGARPYWLGREITVIGAEALSALYARALTAQGVRPSLLTAREATLAGLAALRERR